jgi:hypothetical protein
LIRQRLSDAFDNTVRNTYEIVGEPTTYSEAEALAKEDPFQFQSWALGLVHARPTELKKGADRGIDGRLYFHDDRSGKSKQIIFSVKAGHTNVAHVRDLRGVIEREQAEIGVLITMEEVTKPMQKEAAEAGFYKSPVHKDYPRIQLLSIAQLMMGAAVDHPRLLDATFKQAPKARGAAAKNLTLALGEGPDPD